MATREPKKPMSPEYIARMKHGAEGHDIVGLKPGQHFDPIGDLGKFIAELKAEEAAKLLRAPKKNPKTKPRK